VQWVPLGSTFDEFTMFNVRGTSITLPDWFIAGASYRFRVFAMRADWDGVAHSDQNVTPSSNVVDLTIPECAAAPAESRVVNYSWQQQGADIDGFAAFDLFGYSVATSGDGSVVAIGAPENDWSGPNAGNVQVFAWDGTAWVQRGVDLNAEASNDSFGNSVALSDDGSILAVGAPYNDGTGADSGHVRIFVWDGTSWTQRGGDIDGEAAGDESGWSVALSADGSIVAIGASKNASNTGHVRVYSWNGSAWVQRGVDIDGEATGDLLGVAVDLSDDGTMLAVGGPHNAGTGLIAGHVRIFVWDGTSWAQRGGDIDGEAAGDESGWSVALSANGAIVAIGAKTSADGGYVRVFAWDGTAWVQRGSDLDAEMRTDSTQSIALSDDGTILAIGSHTNDNDNGIDAGHVRVFAWSGTAWVQRGGDIDGEGVASNSGWSVAMSGDGSILAIGGILNSNANGASGHVRVYSWQ
jgi:hypothetical protein